MHMLASSLGLAAVLAVSLSYLCGVWALYGHFRTHSRIESGMQLTSLLSLGGFAWFLFERWRHHALAGSAGFGRDLACLSLMAAFAVLFWWAVAVTRSRRLTLAFSKDQPAFIHTGGPYAVVRHPFYTSYMLFWIGAAIGSASLAYWIIPAVMMTIYTRAVRVEESKFAQSGVASDYARYRARTGMFLPVRPSSPVAGANL